MWFSRWDIEKCNFSVAAILRIQYRRHICLKNKHWFSASGCHNVSKKNVYIYRFINLQRKRTKLFWQLQSKELSLVNMNVQYSNLQCLKEIKMRKVVGWMFCSKYNSASGCRYLGSRYRKVISHQTFSLPVQALNFPNVSLVWKGRTTSS